MVFKVSYSKLLIGIAMYRDYASFTFQVSYNALKVNSSAQ